MITSCGCDDIFICRSVKDKILWMWRGQCVCCVHRGFMKPEQWTSSRFSSRILLPVKSINYKFLWMGRGQCVVYRGALRNHNSEHRVLSARGYCYLYKFCIGSCGSDGVSVLCTQVLYGTRTVNIEPFELENIVTCTSVKYMFLWLWR